MLKGVQDLGQTSANNVEALLRFSEVSLSGLERLIKLQLAAMRQSIEESAQLAQELTQLSNSQDVIARINEVSNASIEKAVATTRELYEVVSQTQNELSRLAESQVNDFNKQLLSMVDQLAHNSPAGSEVGINALKSSIAATAAAFDSMKRAANQVAELTDSSVKTVSISTADVLKQASATFKSAQENAAAVIKSAQNK